MLWRLTPQVNSSGLAHPDLLYKFTVRYSVDKGTLWNDRCNRIFDNRTN